MRAVESRQLHHLQNGADAGALFADSPGGGVHELDLARCVRTVAELVLQALKSKRVDRAVEAETRQQKAREPAGRLRQDQECVAHRRRQKPFMADDRIGVAVRRRGRGVGAHVGTALLFRHPHAKRHAGFIAPGPKQRIVIARDNLGDDLGSKLRLGSKRGERGSCHGHRAKMTGLDLRRHIEARRAYHLRRRRRAVA